MRTRNGDSGVTVRVRVKFLHQVRLATGALKDKPVEIPFNDPPVAGVGDVSVDGHTSVRNTAATGGAHVADATAAAATSVGGPGVR